MRRLALLLLACLLLTSVPLGEERVWRLGVLTTGDWPTSALRTVMVPELACRGFTQGRNLVVVPRWGSGNDDKALAQAAQALADAKSDVIVAVFAGGKVSDMPFEQPTHFKMGINAKIARAVGVELPAALLARADEVIE